MLELFENLHSTQSAIIDTNDEDIIRDWLENMDDGVILDIMNNGRIIANYAWDEWWGGRRDTG